MTTSLEWLALSAIHHIPIRMSDYEANFKTELCRDEHDVFEYLISTRQISMTKQQWLDACRAEKALLHQHSIHLTYPFHADYPNGFCGRPEAPMFWTYQGAPVWKRYLLMAVVGSREPLSQTLTWLDVHLSHFCKQHKEWAIVSGGARGVDQRAHRLALESGSPTAVILPSGLNQIYPKDLGRWSKFILDNGGCLASPFTPNAGMQKYHFLKRNQYIVAMAHGVFVAEANRRSGSQMTARWAGELGKDLATLPVSPMSKQGLASLDLIVNGAQLLRDVDDLSLWSALLPKDLQA